MTTCVNSFAAVRMGTIINGSCQCETGNGSFLIGYRVIVLGLRSLYITYDMFVNCNWVVTRWQYTFTHKQYIEQHK